MARTASMGYISTLARTSKVGFTLATARTYHLGCIGATALFAIVRVNQALYLIVNLGFQLLGD